MDGFGDGERDEPDGSESEEASSAAAGPEEEEMKS